MLPRHGLMPPPAKLLAMFLGAAPPLSPAPAAPETPPAAISQAGPAPAEGDAQSKQRNEALALLRAGNLLLERKRGEEALGKFTEAYRVFASPKLFFNMGEAHALIPHHEAEAFVAMSRFLREVPDAAPALRKAAESECALLRNKIGFLTVSADPPDAVLLVDGVDSGVPRAQQSLPLAPGSHSLILSKEGRISAPRTIALAPGQSITEALVIPPWDQPPALPAAPGPAPAPALLPSASASASPQPSVDLSRKDVPKASEPPPLYQRPWFWGAIAGIVVASGVTAALVLSRDAKTPTPSMGTVR